MNFLRFVPLIAVMGIIFFLSNQPGDSLDLPDIPDLDKGLHCMVYGVLALSALFAVPEYKYQASPFWVSLLVVLFCLLYGISDEFHQSFIPGRFPSVLDLVADTIGAMIVVLVWFRMKKQGSRARG
ncbi:MAG: VanZ family protein [Thermodesulfobacteriota bacterium]|nr:VanZ family protein [Thermodesulfobacteriota bacterium]